MEAALVEEGDQLMAEALGTVLAGQKEVHSKLPKVGKRSSGSQRKHQTSPAYVRLAQEMRMALRMKEHKGGPQGGLEKQSARKKICSRLLRGILHRRQRESKTLSKMPTAAPPPATPERIQEAKEYAREMGNLMAVDQSLQGQSGWCAGTITF